MTQLTSTLCVMIVLGFPRFARQRPQALPNPAPAFRVILLFGTPEPTMDELITRTRKTDQGPLEVGEDLLAISIGESIAVQRLRTRPD